MGQGTRTGMFFYKFLQLQNLGAHLLHFSDQRSGRRDYSSGSRDGGNRGYGNFCLPTQPACPGLCPQGLMPVPCERSEAIVGETAHEGTSYQNH